MNPFATATGSSVQNFTTAIVTDNSDPDNLGRIKIQFPWDDEANQSYWARVVTPMSGDSFGVNFLPEVDDEVLVCFLGGDIQRPVILGSLWNQNLMPPYSNEDGENNIRAIKSRSGHEIILNDKSGYEKIEIKHSNGQRIMLGNGIKIKSSNTNIEIDGDSNISISSAKNITLKSDMEIKIKGMNVSIEADALLELKGAIVRIN